MHPTPTKTELLGKLESLEKRRAEVIADKNRAMGDILEEDLKPRKQQLVGTMNEELAILVKVKREIEAKLEAAEEARRDEMRYHYQRGNEIRGGN